MPLLSLGSMGAGGLPSPYLLDVAMSPGGGLMTLPLPDSLPHSTPDMLTAALQHAGLGGLMDVQSKGGNQMVSLQVYAACMHLLYACFCYMLGNVPLLMLPCMSQFWCTTGK